ncbi:MAG: NADP oxidoreductase, partial [Bryobacteraceae bacterium]
MSKIKLATVWLDGCSGCHMSLLDIDEGIVAVAKKADIVYGPLVDAQEFPESVDVALVEGAVSSQEDMKLAQLIRKRSRIMVALGDCAVTSNVPSMRNWVPAKKLLERVYVEGVQANPGVPAEGVPALLRHAIPLHEAV